MTFESRNIVMGIAMMVVLAVILAVSNLTGRVAQEDAVGGITVDAVFNRVDGLVRGDEVRMGGVRIGTVVGEALDNNYRAVLTLQIDPGIRLPADTSAAIHTDGLFGEKYVVLEPGGEEIDLKTGDTITFTQDALIVRELLDLIIGQGRANQAKRAAAK